jgi:hypothetical protein
MGEEARGPFSPCLKLKGASSSRIIYISNDFGDEIIFLRRINSVKFTTDCKAK